MKPAKYRPESAHAFLQHPHDGSAWRIPAREQLSLLGLPTPKLERWKYTNILAFEKSGAAPAAKTRFEGDVVRLPWMQQNSRKLLFVNGHLILGDGKMTMQGSKACDVPDLAPMQKFDDMMLWALNATFCQDGPAIILGKGEESQTVEIIHIAQGGSAPLLASPRSTFKLADNAKVTIIEQWIGTGDGIVHTNHATQIELGQGANLNHIRLQNDRTDRTVLSSTHIRAARDAQYTCNFLTTGAGLSRQEFWGELLGTGADITINGAQLMGGRQVMDTTILVEHAAPRCTSNQTIKNVVDGRATGVFQGKVHVHQIAQLTDGYQLCNTIMLSDTAEMNIKPELEIYADDVKCSHGTTTGCVDETALFYLRARGIPESTARNMLLEAFIASVFDNLPEDIAEVCLTRTQEWLQNDHGSAA